MATGQETRVQVTKHQQQLDKPHIIKPKRDSLLLQHFYYLNKSKTKGISVGVSPHCDFQPVVRIEKVGSSGVQLSLVEWKAFSKLFPALRDLFNTPIEEERYFFKLSDIHEVVVATLYNQRQVILRKISSNTSAVSSSLKGDVDMVFLAETSWHGLQNLLDCVVYAIELCDGVSSHIKDYFHAAVQHYATQIQDFCAGCKKYAGWHQCNTEDFLRKHLPACQILQPTPTPRLDVYRLQHEVFAMTKKRIFRCVLTTLQLRLADKTMAVPCDMDNMA